VTQSGAAAKASAVITWPQPASITYGTALSSTQLDATATPANVYPSATYSPAAGKIVSVGNVTLTVTFAERGDGNYGTTSATTTLQVVQAPSTTSITSSSTSVNLNANGSVSVPLDSQVTNTYKPTGSVTLQASTGEVCSGTVASLTGDSSCKLIFTTTGTRTITATYSGDANHTGSNNSTQSPAVTVTINPHP
jgi:large repetitive protein